MQRLAIVGSHIRTRDLAPWDDLAVPIWTMNEIPQADWCKRWDVCFQLHKPEIYTSPRNMVRSDHWDWLQLEHGGKTIYMQAMDPRVPGCEVYPLEEVVSALPGGYLRWFDSTMAYMLALALYEGYREIDLYGLDMSSNSEYGYQLRNFQFWVGVALGMGARFGVLSNELRFQYPLYGYEGEVELPRDYFHARAADLEKLFKQLDWKLAKLKDRLQEAMGEGKPARVAELMPELELGAIEAGEASGMLAAAEGFAGRSDPISRQEYERMMAQSQRDGEQLRSAMYHAGGQAEYVWNVWKRSGSNEALSQLKLYIGKKTSLAFDVGAHSGIFKEARTYMAEIDSRIQAAGGEKTFRALTDELNVRSVDI